VFREPVVVAEEIKSREDNNKEEEVEENCSHRSIVRLVSYERSLLSDAGQKSLRFFFGERKEKKIKKQIKVRKSLN
jgi:hypothetical protein